MIKPVVGINQHQADQQTIDTLKDLLSRAESGELRSILYVDKYRDGTCGFGWAGSPDDQMIGKIDAAKFAYHTQTCNFEASD